MKLYPLLAPLVLFLSFLAAQPLAAQPLAAQPPASEVTVTELADQAQTLLHSGHQDAAFARFRQILDRYSTGRLDGAAELSVAAAAAAELGVTDPQLYKDAVHIYDQAIAADPQYLPARVALGELLLDKYNNTEALQLFREALQIDPENPAALLGLARSQHFDFSPQALATVNQALSLAPHFAPARVFAARLYAELENYADAELEAVRALRAQPDSLAALSVLAAVYYLSGEQQKFRDTERRALELNPRYADLYNELAELAARNRLYQAAVDFAARAVGLNPQSWRGHGLLGMNQLRVGAIEAGRASLEKAFAGDPYNVWVKNTLDLADTFDQYELLASEHFRLFVHRDEETLLGPPLLALAEQAYRRFRERYDYAAPAPIRVEVYPRHADFSVRTVGLAGMGILGVSFGPVVAMDSPTGRPLGTFNWGSTLWHELAHTFHLGLSGHRVPRWFSEGLAVFEERQARPGWGADASVDFLLAYHAGKLLPVSELNNGFVRPSYPQQIVHSYYQASLVFDYIDAEWGFDAIRAMLNGYREGLSTEQLIERELGLTAVELDAAFDSYFQTRFAGPLAALSNPPQRLPPALLLERAASDAGQDDFGLQLQAGRAAFEADDLAEAERRLRRAQILFPEYAGDDSPPWLLAKLYRQRGRLQEAAEQLGRMVAINGEHFDAHLQLAELHRELGDPAAAAEVLHRATYIYPFSLSLQQRIATLSTELEDWPAAIGARQAVLALKPTDRAEARYQLAKTYASAGQPRQARRELLRTLELAPDFDRALELLLELQTGS